MKLLSLFRLSGPMDCSLPVSSVHGIFQARVLEWGAIAFSFSSCRTSQSTHHIVTYIGEKELGLCLILVSLTSLTSNCVCSLPLLLQSCPTLCDPGNGSPPGSRVPGILQARTLEWVAISFSSVLVTWLSCTDHLIVPAVITWLIMFSCGHGWM